MQNLLNSKKRFAASIFGYVAFFSLIVIIFCTAVSNNLFPKITYYQITLTFFLFWSSEAVFMTILALKNWKSVYRDVVSRLRRNLSRPMAVIYFPFASVLGVAMFFALPAILFKLPVHDFWMRGRIKGPLAFTGSFALGPLFLAILKSYIVALSRGTRYWRHTTGSQRCEPK